MEQKETVTTRLRNKNEAVLKGSGASLYQGHARFVADKVVEVSAGEESIQLTAETIVINTGAKSRVLPIKVCWIQLTFMIVQAFRTWKLVLTSWQLSVVVTLDWNLLVFIANSA